MKVVLIIPCYNFASQLAKTFEKIEKWRSNLNFQAHVCFVDDGSTDQTWEYLSKYAAQNQTWCHTIRQSQNFGKGAAIRAGFKKMTESTESAESKNGEPTYIFFTDCDLHYGLKIISEKFIPSLEEGQNDVVIADRSWSASAHHASLMRKLTSGIFNRCMSILTGVSFRDSQAGLKGFRVKTCKPVFDLLTMNGFTIDVEILSIALFYRLRVSQISVKFGRNYEFPRDSSIRVLKSSFKMLLDLIRINFNWKSGKYRHPELISRVDQSLYLID